MIQANEIRVGNKFIREIHNQRGLEYDHDFVMDEIMLGKFFSPDTGWALQDLFPIPLTIEVLLENGFKLNDDAGNWHSPEHTIYSTKYMSVGVKGDYIGRYNSSEDDFYSSFYPQLKSLHQLQNLYFVLYGEDLKVQSSEPKAE